METLMRSDTMKILNISKLIISYMSTKFNKKWMENKLETLVLPRFSQFS